MVVNPSKCAFGRSEVKFLGYLVTEQGTKPLPDRVSAIKNYPLPATAKELRQFLGMLNFYRRFMPRTAQIQAPMNALLGGAIKGKTPIKWTTEARSAFDQCKEDLANATLLAHPGSDADLALVTDASDTAIGAVLQQRIDREWEPLAFFSKKLSPAETKYSAFDRELLAIYLAIKHFQHLVESRDFKVFTDHKPITFAFRQKSDKCSPRQFRHLDFIGQFTTDIRHISGINNVVADALSRIDEIRSPPNYQALAESQHEDEEFNRVLQKDTGLNLERVQIPGTDILLYCDTSTGKTRPFLTEPYRKPAFEYLHGLSHPGIKATVKLIAQRYVWPSLKSDYRNWARACIQCQRSKVSRHVTTHRGNFPASERFRHIHIDLIIMPNAEGKRYCLTCVDRFTRWPEAFPLENQEAETVARALYDGWICRFGVPSRITTDQGRQFESDLFRRLNQLIGSAHLRTTAYHPQANGMVERLHRQLKAAIKCHTNAYWKRTLSTVLLGIRVAWKEDMQTTSAELVYGEQLRLPGEFLSATDDKHHVAAPDFIKSLRQHFKELRPAETKYHGEQKTFIFKDLATSQQVFVRHDGPRNILQGPYDGPYTVIEKRDKAYLIRVNGKETLISVDRLKPAYIIEENLGTSPDNTFTKPTSAEETARPPTVTKYATRAGRRVVFTDRYQAGFA